MIPIGNFKNKNYHYDIVIIGAGIAGLSSCRHLLLKLPELRNKRIAIIEPRSTIRNNLAEDYKVGESTIEISAMFLCKELGLQDYMIENHSPKFALQFHWPKSIDKTDTMDDYYSTWSTQNPNIQAFQLNRAKMERDLLKMVIDQGAKYIHGRAKDIDLTPGDRIKTIQVQLLSNTENFNDQKVIDNIILTCNYIIDASGRNFTIGSRTDNLITDPEQLHGLKNASTWIRVKNVDKKLFDFNNPNVTASWYYATNHFFGPGYWLWMIPIERGSHDFSIGISYHRDKIDPSQLNSFEKFMNFLERNQKILYNLIKSGELVDFHRWPKIAHTSKLFYSHDNWAVLGDAAAIFDPFYSTGIGMMAVEIECLTELIRLKQSGKVKEYQSRTTSYNNFIKCITDLNCHLLKKHSDHLGNASTMSWRIYIESSGYFGVDIPAYIGKYHLCPKSIEMMVSEHPSRIALHDLMLETMDDINDKALNIGFIDNHRGGQLPFTNWSPITSWDYDNALNLCKYDSKRLNLPTYLTWNSLYQLLMYTVFYKRAYGFKGLFNRSYLSIISSISSKIPLFYIGSWIHYFENKNKPHNDYFDKIEKDFNVNYKYSTKNQIIPF